MRYRVVSDGWDAVYSGLEFSLGDELWKLCGSEIGSVESAEEYSAGLDSLLLWEDGELSALNSGDSRVSEEIGLKLLEGGSEGGSVDGDDENTARLDSLL